MNNNFERNIINISPYDDSFPTRLLSNAFDQRIEESNHFVDRVYQTVTKSHANLDDFSDRVEDKMRLVVDTTDELLQQYEDGTIKLVQENGSLFAQVRENGRYGKKLAIKEEHYIEGSNALDADCALQIKAIQDSLAVISEQVMLIDKNVREVIAGQQNDRLGLYYSGVALYVEAMNVSDSEMKKQLIAQSLKALTDSCYQLNLSLRSNIRYLKQKEYYCDKKNSYNLIVEKMNNINQEFSAIHQASILKAGIYCEQGEIKAMTCVLQEYSRFIEGTIAKNAYMLAQCDTSDNGKLDGVWKSRAQLKINISNIVEQLSSSDKVIYIEQKGETNNESF